MHLQVKNLLDAVGHPLVGEPVNFEIATDD
jgi:hypothetical protein